MRPETMRKVCEMYHLFSFFATKSYHAKPIALLALMLDKSAHGSCNMLTLGKDLNYRKYTLVNICSGFGN